MPLKDGSADAIRSAFYTESMVIYHTLYYASRKLAVQYMIETLSVEDERPPLRAFSPRTIGVVPLSLWEKRVAFHNLRRERSDRRHAKDANPNPVNSIRGTKMARMLRHADNERRKT
jgi:hypothetical protein